VLTIESTQRDVQGEKVVWSGTSEVTEPKHAADGEFRQSDDREDEGRPGPVRRQTTEQAFILSQRRKSCMFALRWQ
jgi:hypothetical protein